MHNKIRLTLLFIICTLFGMWLINRDLFQYSFTYPYAREFESSTSEKGYYQILESLTLKPGNYKVRFTGHTTGKQNGYSIRDRDGEILSEDNFDKGEISRDIELVISGSARQVQFGILFEGDSSRLRIDRIEVSCDHVLYRESLSRHAVTSLFYLAAIFFIFLRISAPAFMQKRIPVLFRGENERVILFLFIISLFSCFPLMIRSGYVLADDMQFHLSRIEGIARSWQAGIFPARIHLYVIEDYGYGSGFFYPQLWLCIPALLRILGFSCMASYNIFVVLCTFLSVTAVYSCTKHIGKNLYGALAASVLFCFAPYRLIDIYYRGALGEIQSFVFLPIIIYALYDIMVLHKGKWMLLAFGFFGLLGSHIISFTTVCIIMAVFTVFSLFFSRQRGFLIINLVKAALLTVLTSCYFLLPMAEQWKKTDIVVNTLLSNANGSILEKRMLPWRNLFRYFETWTAKNPWPGLCMIAMIIITALCLRKKDRKIKTSHILAVLSLICLFISTDLFPWQLPLFSWLFIRIQFSWRFLLIPTVFLPVAGGICMPELFDRISARIWFTAVLFSAALCAEPVLNEALTHRFVETPQFILQRNRIGGGEYLPRDLSAEFADKNRDTVYYNGFPLPVTDHDRHGLGFRFSYDLPSVDGSDIFEIPLSFYSGYHARLTAADGKGIPLDVFQSGKGLTAVSSITGNNGSVEVWYEKTFVQKTGEIISLVTALICCAAVLTGRKGKIHRDTSDV